jgi:hypothetical protein
MKKMIGDRRVRPQGEDLVLADGACPGDCDRDGEVSLAELTR